MVCGIQIVTMAFKGSGVCSDAHRKERDGDDQAHLKPIKYHDVTPYKGGHGGNQSKQ